MDGGCFWAAMSQQLLKFAASKLEESLESEDPDYVALAELAEAEVGSPAAEASEKPEAKRR